jgi:hypothetical protein
MNPTTEAAYTRVLRSIGDLRAIIAGMSEEALNWQPAPETNSIAAQVAHVIESSRFYLGAAGGGNRDMTDYVQVREKALKSRAAGAELASMLDDFEKGLQSGFEAVPAARLGDIIDLRRWDRGAVTVAWCVHEVFDHVREHVGAAALTRQLWEQRSQE